MSQPDCPEFRSQLEVAKLQALAEFAAGAGHEINNPIATIVGYVQQLLAEETNPDRRHALTTIGGQAYRVRDMIGDVILFARPPRPRPELLDLAAVCREVAQKHDAQAADKSCRIDLEASEIRSIFADPIQLRIVISALLRNSIEAMAESGHVAVSATSVEFDERPWAVLRITDHGRGLSPADREHLFDPFYSGRQAGRGLGFGLSKAWRIVTLHGGRMNVDSPAAGGVQFTIHWPAASIMSD